SSSSMASTESVCQAQFASSFCDSRLLSGAGSATTAAGCGLDGSLTSGASTGGASSLLGVVIAGSAPPRATEPTGPDSRPAPARVTEPTGPDSSPARSEERRVGQE